MNKFYDCIGIFVKESKNRFLCIVRIDGIETEVYVQSSCRLENFIDLRGKKVYLKKIDKPKRVKYTLVAFCFKRNFSLLSPKMANDIFYRYLLTKRSAHYGLRKKILKEYQVEEYKSDFYIPITKTIFEIKALLSFDSTAIFPTVYSERALIQLNNIEKLLKKGYKCYYIVISLNPLQKNLCINTETKFGSKLLELEKQGLIVEFKYVKFNKGFWTLYNC